MLQGKAEVQQKDQRAFNIFSQIPLCRYLHYISAHFRYSLAPCKTTRLGAFLVVVRCFCIGIIFCMQIEKWIVKLAIRTGQMLYKKTLRCNDRYIPRVCHDDGNRGQGHLFIARLQVSMIVSSTKARDPGNTSITAINQCAYHHTSTKASLSAAAYQTLQGARVAQITIYCVVWGCKSQQSALTLFSILNEKNQLP